MDSPRIPRTDQPAAPWPELVELARRFGVATAYRDGLGVDVEVGAPTLVAVLRAFDVDAADTAACRHALRELDARRVPVEPACVVLRAGRERSGTPAAVTVRAEAGERVTAALMLGADPADPDPPAPARPDAALAAPAVPVLPVRPPAGGADGLTTVTLPLPEDLPVGAHTLRVTVGDVLHRVTVLVAPERLPVPEAIAERQAWGYTLQLHALRSRASWGMGDLADLAEFTRTCAADLGAGFVVANPLHAGSPVPPIEPSPYLPVSRRFFDPAHLRIERIPEYAATGLPAATRARIDGLAAAARRHGADDLIDRDAVWAAKQEALRLLHRVPLAAERARAYRAYLDREGEELRAFATWCVLAERHGVRWQDWPPALRDPGSPEVARLRTTAPDELDFHCWTQWQLDQQLAAVRRTARVAGMAIGVVHDLAVGSSASGAETWAEPGVYATGMTVGAPPDNFNQQGQTWGSRPWRPDRLAATGYAPYRAMLRAVLRHADGLRIDHVMGLFRLWWVPDGMPASAGTYVSYDHAAMLGVLALEAHAAGALVVGEDLGTVEPAVHTVLGSWGAFGTSVLWFERDDVGRPLPPEQWRRDCLATLTTHDLPTTASRLSGDHVGLRHRLGLLAGSPEDELRDARADAAAWLDVLRADGLLPPAGQDAEPGELILALHRLLLRSPCRLVGVWLPDVFGDTRPHNLPGTTGATYPNWRLPIADAAGRPVLLDDMAADPRLRALATALSSGVGHV